MKELEENIGKEAGLEVRAETLKLLREKGPSLKKVILRLKQALNAKETKAQFDTKRGVWVYSDPLISHDIRLKAIKLALTLYDAFPAQKHEVKARVDVSPLLKEIREALLEDAKDT